MKSSKLRGSRRPNPGLPSGARLTLIVLLVGLGLSSYLAFQAFQAHRSQGAAVNRALESVSQMLATRLLGWIQGDFAGAGLRTFERLDGFDGLEDDVELPGPEIIEARNIVGVNFRAPLATEDGIAFRFDLNGSVFVPSSPGVDESVLSALPAALSEAAGDSEVREWLERFGMSWRPRLLVLEGEGEPVVVAYRVLSSADGTPRAVYGLLLPGEGFFQESVRGALERREVWTPMALWTEDPDEPVFTAVALEGPGGTVLSRLGDEPLRPGSPVTRLQIALADVQLRTELHPAAVERLGLGGSARDRTAVYLLLLLLNGGLVLAAVFQIRKERVFIRRRTEFIAGFSHEARHPLATIRLYAQALRFGRIRNASGRSRALDIIDRESRRLVHMVSNFLDHGASESETLRLSPRPIALSEELRAIAEAVRSDVEASRSRLHLHLADRVWIDGDPTALQQIIRNLVGNSLKYGPAGQTIRIGLKQEGPHAVVNVEDQGPGIPKEEREVVFEPFVRTPTGIRSGAGGSGLGLSIVRELVAMQGGVVRVEEPRSGRGTRISVSFPVLNEDPAARTRRVERLAVAPDAPGDPSTDRAEFTEQPLAMKPGRAQGQREAEVDAGRLPSFTDGNGR
jgi:signal transduction histidine kinase